MPALDISRAEVALASGDLATLGSELATLFPLDPDVDRVQDLIRLALGQPAPELTLSGTASVFFDSIQKNQTPARLRPARANSSGAESDRQRPGFYCESGRD